MKALPVVRLQLPPLPTPSVAMEEGLIGVVCGGLAVIAPPVCPASQSYADIDRSSRDQIGIGRGGSPPFPISWTPRVPTPGLVFGSRGRSHSSCHLHRVSESFSFDVGIWCPALFALYAVEGSAVWKCAGTTPATSKAACVPMVRYAHANPFSFAGERSDPRSVLGFLMRIRTRPVSLKRTI